MTIEKEKKDLVEDVTMSAAVDTMNETETGTGIVTGTGIEIEKGTENAIEGVRDTMTETVIEIVGAQDTMIEVTEIETGTVLRAVKSRVTEVEVAVDDVEDLEAEVAEEEEGVVVVGTAVDRGLMVAYLEVLIFGVVQRLKERYRSLNGLGNTLLGTLKRLDMRI